MFLEALDMNLSSFLEVFPLLSSFYTYLRSFAVAITAIIAGRALATFWFGSIENSARDNPLIILVKTFFSVAAIYWGGYVLEYIVHLGSIPYNLFLNIEAVTGGRLYFKEFITGFFGFASASIASWGNLAKGLCEIFLLIVIAWNLFKLVVEICERWLMVGVLVYTSPLVYCTIPSSDTSGIFRKWVSMFIGSVIQMSLSVMFLKLILSGFNTRPFRFEGFLPTEKKERDAVLKGLKEDPATLIFYEAPHRLAKTVGVLLEALGDRNAAFCKELTKKHENIRRIRLSEAKQLFEAEEPRGEFVIVVEGADTKKLQEEKQAAFQELPLEEHMARYLAEGLDKKEAMKRVAEDRGVPKREIYKALLPQEQK